MSFVDSLSQTSINDQRAKEKETKIQSAISHFISDLETAIKTQATKAAQNNKKSLSGFFVTFCGYGGDPYGAFVDQWEDSKETTKRLSKLNGGDTANIYRIDRIVDGFIETRYGGSFCKPTDVIVLSDIQIREFQNDIESTIRNLGFTKFTVKTVQKQFYQIESKTTHGFFGLKTQTKRYDDGIGKVLYIELFW